MNPENVPGELIVIACDAWRAAPQKRDGKPTRMRYALAAVMPEVERRVREQTLREAADLLDAQPLHCEKHSTVGCSICPAGSDHLRREANRLANREAQ